MGKLTISMAIFNGNFLAFQERSRLGPWHSAQDFAQVSRTMKMLPGLAKRNSWIHMIQQ